MISRALNILEFLNKNKSVLLFGPRGCGKTALLLDALGKHSSSLAVDLLRSQAYLRYLVNPSLFGDEVRTALKKTNSPLLVTIDEVQKIPALLDEVHALIESYKGKIVFLLTGSSARKLKRSGANLLAGRAITKYLHPLSSLELDISLSRALQYGTLPSIYLDEGTEIETLESYVSTYLQQEIQQESLVRGIDRFSRFLDFAAQLNGEPINFSKLGKQTGVAGKTAAEYYSILIDTLLVRQLSGWSHSVKRQLLQAPKFYLFDCGVLNAMNGELRTELKPNSFRFGRLFENFIIQELFRANDYKNLGLRFHYWRDKDGHEVDLLVSRSLAKALLAIEIKSSPTPKPEDCPGFFASSEDFPNIERWCLCTAEKAYEKSGILFLPWQEGVKMLAEKFA